MVKAEIRNFSPCFSDFSPLFLPLRVACTLKQLLRTLPSYFFFVVETTHFFKRPFLFDSGIH
jgi:hypothetical protein